MILTAITAAAIAHFLLYLLVALIALAVIYYVLTNFLPDPLKRWAIVSVVVIGAIILIYFLLDLAGEGRFFR
jgi:amino acid transporter